MDFYWPMAIAQDYEDGNVHTALTYNSCSEEEAHKWLDDLAKESKVLFSYIHDDNKNIVYYDTIFDKLDNVKNNVMNSGKFYSRAIIQNSEDNSFCRWYSYDEYSSLGEAKSRINDIKYQFRTLFSYVEKVDDDGNKSIAYYENNLDPFGNVKYWDSTKTNSNKR